jgi:hypothetical protein
LFLIGYRYKRRTYEGRETIGVVYVIEQLNLVKTNGSMDSEDGNYVGYYKTIGGKLPIY